MKTEIERMFVGGYKFVVEYRLAEKGFVECKVFSGGIIWDAFKAEQHRPDFTVRERIRWTFIR